MCVGTMTPEVDELSVKQPSNGTNKLGELKDTPTPSPRKSPRVIVSNRDSNHQEIVTLPSRRGPLKSALKNGNMRQSHTDFIQFDPEIDIVNQSQEVVMQGENLLNEDLSQRPVSITDKSSFITRPEIRKSLSEHPNRAKPPRKPKNLPDSKIKNNAMNFGIISKSPQSNFTGSKQKSEMDRTTEFDLQNALSKQI